MEAAVGWGGRGVKVWQEGGQCAYKKERQETLVVLELFSILTMVVNTTAYKYDKIVYSMQMSTKRSGEI